MSKPYREYTENDIWNLAQEIKKLEEIQKAEFEIYKSHERFWDREFQKLCGKLSKIKEYCIESLHTIEKHKIYKMCDEYLILCKIKEIIESEG